MTEATNENNTKLTLWNRVLASSVKMPFVKVDRDEFLNKELSKFCTPLEVMTAINESPLNVLTKKEIDKLANQCIILWSAVFIWKGVCFL